MAQESPYYTPEQAAVILQKTPDTVRRLCQRGEIPGARKIGREWLIPRVSIDPAPQPQQPTTPRQAKEPSI